MSFDYNNLLVLTDEQRAEFYARLSNNLTIYVRKIYGHEEWTNAEKVERMSRLNEIQHRVTSAAFGSKRDMKDWKDWLTPGLAETVAHYVGDDKELLFLVEQAVERTYIRVTQP